MRSITRAIAALAGKATTAQVRQATLTRADIHGSRYRTREDQYLIQRYVGYTAIAANINARPLSTLPVRLYRKKSTLKLGGMGGPQSGGITIGADTTQPLTLGRRLHLKRIAPLTGRKTMVDAVEADDVEEVMEHPVLDLLYRPNSEMGQVEFLDIVQTFRMIPGLAPVHAQPGPNGPVALWPMFPQLTRMEADKTGERLVKSYWYGPPDAQVEIPAEEVLPFRYRMSPFDPMRAWCPIMAAMDEHDIYHASNELKLQLWENGLMPWWVISPKGTESFTPDNRKTFERSLYENHRGVSKALGALISTLPIDVNRLSWSPSEVNDDASREAAIDMIGAAYGIPSPLMRMNDSILANANSAMRFHQQVTLEPHAIQTADTLTEYLLPMYKLDTSTHWLVFDSPVQEDEQIARDTAVSIYTGGIATLNEARRIVGLDAREDGDELKKPEPSPFGGFGLGINGSLGAGAPGEDKTPPTPGIGIGKTIVRIENDDRGTGNATAGPRDGAGSKCADGGNERGGGAGADAGEPCEDHGADGPCGCAGTGVRVLQSERVHKDCIGWLQSLQGSGGVGKAVDLDPSPVQEPVDVRLFWAIEAMFRQQRDAFTTAMVSAPQGLQFGRVVTKDDRDDRVERLMQRWGMLDYELWARRFNGATRDVMTEALRQAVLLGYDKLRAAGVEAGGGGGGGDGGRIGGGEYGDGGDFYLRTERGLEFLRQYLDGYERRFVDVNRTTGEAVRATLIEGLDEGESLSQLTTRVRSVFDAEGVDGEPVTRVRAAMIARTETARSQVHGQRNAYEQAGVQRVRWSLAPNACEFCRAAAQRHGESDIGKPFFAQGTVLEGLDGGMMTLDFEDVFGPPLHPNDRCDLVPVIVG